METVGDALETASPSPSVDAAAPVSVDVVCRQDWGAQPAGASGVSHRVTGVMVHHPAVVANDGDDEATRFLGYQRYHQEQSWPDVAYHLGIGRSGAFYELRDPRTAGDTFTEYDPAGWFLILVDGHFDEQDPTEAQLSSVRRAIAWACATYDVPPQDVAGHRDEASTTCPGDRMYELLPQLGREAAELMRRGGVRLAPTCDDQAFAAAWGNA